MNSADNLVKYTGASIPELCVENGMSLDIVLSIILKTILELKNKTVTIDGKTISPIDAIIKIYEKANNITSDDIKLNGEYKIGTSMATQPFLNKSFTYNIDLSDNNNLIFTFNYNSILENLPSNYNLIYIRTTAYSIDSNNPSSLIQDNDQLSGVISIPFYKLPANVKTDIRFNTPQGDILLTTTNPIISAVKSSGLIVMSIQDMTTDKTSKTSSISDWTKVITSEINNVNNIKNQLDQFKISGFNNVPDQKGIFNCISAISSICDTAVKDIIELDTVNLPDFGVCADSATTGSIQKAVDSLTSIIKTQEIDISTIRQQLIDQNKYITDMNSYLNSVINANANSTLNTNTYTSPDQINGGASSYPPVQIEGGTVIVTTTSGGCGRGGTCP